MSPKPPSLHFPSPYERPSVAPSVARYVETPDGARLAVFVYGELGPPSAVLPFHFGGEAKSTEK